MTNVEQEICKRVVAALTPILNGVEIDGNWLPSKGEEFKGEPDAAGDKVTVTVANRSYPKYTTVVAEIKVAIDGEIKNEDDPTGAVTFARSNAVNSLMTSWQHCLKLAKSTLSVIDDGGASVFSVVGFRAEQGDGPTIDEEGLTRLYHHSFTVMGIFSERRN